MKIYVRIRHERHGGVREIWDELIHVPVCAGQLTDPVRHPLRHLGCDVWRILCDGDQDQAQVCGGDPEGAFIYHVLQLPTHLLYAYQL